MLTLRSCVVGVVAVLLVGTPWADAAAQDPPNLQALWDDPDTEIITFNFNQNAQDPLCADPNGYCAAWVPTASQECKDNYRFGTDDQATVTRLLYEQCVYEMIFRPFLSQTAPRGVPTRSASAIETAARLQAAGWNSPRALGNPDIVATSDVPDILVNDAREALIIAQEALGRYGPLRVYIVGNDVSVVEPVIHDFCNWSYGANSANNVKCPGNEGQGESMREMAYIYPGGNAFAQHSWTNDPPTQSFVLNPGSDANNQFEAINNPKSQLDENVITVHEYFHIYQNAHVIYRGGWDNAGRSLGEGYKIPRWMEESNAVYFSLVIGDQRAWNIDLLSRIDEQVESIAIFRNRFPALSIADIETEARTTRVQAYCGELCVGQLQYEYALVATKLLVNRSSDNTLFVDFYQHSTTMGWAAAFEKAFGLSVETFYQELEAFLQQPLAAQKTQLRHPPTPAEKAERRGRPLPLLAPSTNSDDAPRPVRPPPTVVERTR
jgi:hypothetical protein